MFRIFDRGGEPLHHMAGFNNRSAMRRENIFGIIAAENGGKCPIYRSGRLELYNRYYDNSQYDHLEPWLEANKKSQHVSIRERQPLVKYPYAKVLANRISAKLIGQNSFPKFESVDDANWQEYVRVLLTHTFLRSKIKSAIQRMLAIGSGFVRFHVKDAAFVFDCYNSNVCYPEFNSDGSLRFVKVQYMYADKDDKDENGEPRKKWFRLDLSTESDISYDNPPYDPNSEPEFTPMSEFEHRLGFVQGEWFRSTQNGQTADGDSLIADVLDFIDSFNYSLSQSDQAVAYNQDPQLVFTKMTDDETQSLIRSVLKSWNLGRDGEAKFLESDLTGVEKAEQLRDKVRLNMGDITRLVMHDPEKMAAHAQSGRSLEILNGPLVELVEELRPMMEPSLISMVTKMALINMLLVRLGLPAPITVPPGFAPNSIALVTKWPRVFPMTMNDLKEKAGVASAITGATIASRDWALDWMAQDLDIQDVEYERERIKAQPIINPFGAF